MGHDIYGYKKTDLVKDKPIAYLRHGAGSTYAREIYKALDAVELDGGCSGIGEERAYSNKQLKEALTRLPKDESGEQARQFLRECLRSKTEIVIFFG